MQHAGWLGLLVLFWSNEAQTPVHRANVLLCSHTEKWTSAQWQPETPCEWPWPWTVREVRAIKTWRNEQCDVTENWVVSRCLSIPKLMHKINNFKSNWGILLGLRRVVPSLFWKNERKLAKRSQEMKCYGTVPDVTVHTCNPRNWGWGGVCLEFQVSLGYIVKIVSEEKERGKGRKRKSRREGRGEEKNANVYSPGDAARCQAHAYRA